jgi:hypothetical protein
MWSRAEIDGQIAEIDDQIQKAEQPVSAMQQAFSTWPQAEQTTMLLSLDAKRQLLQALKQYRAQLLEEAAHFGE